MDIFDAAKRSEIMGRIKGKNTSPELLVFRYLRRQSIYFQKHYKRAPGSPDVALPRRKKAVFIHGDFWHGQTLDKLIERRGDDDFWVRKIKRNIRRDAHQEGLLIQLGWQILVVWESDLKREATRDKKLDEIRAFLTTKQMWPMGFCLLITKPKIVILNTTLGIYEKKASHSN